MDDLMTTAEVALATRAPESTVRYWRFIGTGPTGFKMGRRTVYRRSDVEAWLQAQYEGAQKAARR